MISPEQMADESPDAVLVLPWNLIDELRLQLLGVELVTAIPSLEYWKPTAEMTETPSRKIPYTAFQCGLEVQYATDAATNGWGEHCYDYITRFEAAFKAYLSVAMPLPP